MSIQQTVDTSAGIKTSTLINVNVAGQEASGGDSGTDLPVFLNGKAFRWNCANVAGIAQKSSDFPNFLRTEIIAGQRAPYDEFNDRPYLRTEISERDRTGNTNLENWIAFDFYLLDGSGLQPYPSDDLGQAMICQIKTSPDDTSGAPLLRIEARSNCMRVAVCGNVGGGADDVITNWTNFEPFRERINYSFIAQTIRSVDGASGTLRLWMNGRLIIEDTDVPIGHSTTNYIWNKFGLYCYDTVTNASAIHSNMLCGVDLSYLLTRPYPRCNIGY